MLNFKASFCGVILTLTWNGWWWPAGRLPSCLHCHPAKELKEIISVWFIDPKGWVEIERRDVGGWFIDSFGDFFICPREGSLQNIEHILRNSFSWKKVWALELKKKYLIGTNQWQQHSPLSFIFFKIIHEHATHRWKALSLLFQVKPSFSWIVLVIFQKLKENKRNTRENIYLVKKKVKKIWPSWWWITYELATNYVWIGDKSGKKATSSV